MATTVMALVDAGYRVVVVTTAESPEPLDWGIDRPTGLTVICRPNVGYDFGSWATALHRYPVIADAQRVLLLNDSIVGPFTTIEPLLGKFQHPRRRVGGHGHGAIRIPPPELRPGVSRQEPA